MINLEKEVKRLINKYITKDANLILAERIFVAKTVLSWVQETTKEPKAIKYYMNEIEKHLKGEITLYWEDGIVKVKKE